MSGNIGLKDCTPLPSLFPSQFSTGRVISEESNSRASQLAHRWRRQPKSLIGVHMVNKARYAALQSVSKSGANQVVSDTIMLSVATQEAVKPLARRTKAPRGSPEVQGRLPDEKGNSRSEPPCQLEDRGPRGVNTKQGRVNEDPGQTV